MLRDYDTKHENSKSETLLTYRKNIPNNGR